MPVKSKHDESSYRLRITLLDVEPAVWRRIEVPGGITLRALHGALQIAVGWENCHLFRFDVGDARYGPPEAELAPDVRDDRKSRLEQVAPNVGAVMTYLYDFGDGWRHKIVVEEIQPADKPVVPACLDGERACPPEDVGGPWRYTDYLAAISDPAHPEHDELLDWRGPFDPEAFDLDRVNRQLKRV